MPVPRRIDDGIGIARNRGFVGDLEFRCPQSAVTDGTGRCEIRAEEIEHRGCPRRILAEAEGIVFDGRDPEFLVPGAGIEGPQPVSETDHRLAQFSPIRARDVSGIPGFRIEQYCPDHGPQIPPHPRAIIVEGGTYPGDVVPAGIGGHQALDQLLPDKGTDIGMVEQRIERDAQTFITRCAGRDNYPANDPLFAGGCMIGIDFHRLVIGNRFVGRPIDGSIIGGIRKIGSAPAQSGEDPRHAGDLGLSIGRDAIAAAIQPESAVGIEFGEPNRK